MEKRLLDIGVLMKWKRSASNIRLLFNFSWRQKTEARNSFGVRSISHLVTLLSTHELWLTDGLNVELNSKSIESSHSSFKDPFSLFFINPEKPLHCLKYFIYFHFCSIGYWPFINIYTWIILETRKNYGSAHNSML